MRNFETAKGGVKRSATELLRQRTPPRVVYSLTLPQVSFFLYYSPPMTRLLLAASIVFSACFIAPQQTQAQARRGVSLRVGRTLDDLKPGARLRVNLQDAMRTRLEGKLQGFGQTSMFLEVDGKKQELPFTSILVVDESYRDRKRAAIVGGAAALVLVYAWDFFGPHPNYVDQKQRYRENAEAVAIGVPVSAAIGWAIGWHRWRAVSTLSR